MELPKELLTILLAILPITEIRASIPIAISIYGLSPAAAFFWSVIGNIITTFFLLWCLSPAVNFLTKQDRWIKRLIDWIFQRTRDKAVKKYLKYGQWALILFVAIPLPGTGAWTGALIAFLFDIPKGRALVLITVGILLAATLVTLVTLGTISSINFFNL
ncbi:small multi-drug export protein [Patescibacteria group bacterium]|nr:small multi-drug export protein [Patescibacteria group bacterium]